MRQRRTMSSLHAAAHLRSNASGRNSASQTRQPDRPGLVRGATALRPRGRRTAAREQPPH
eukprot:16128575-Heterocapsa_arctica.AAC.1